MCEPSGVFGCFRRPIYRLQQVLSGWNPALISGDGAERVLPNSAASAWRKRQPYESVTLKSVSNTKQPRRGPHNPNTLTNKAKQLRLVLVLAVAVYKYWLAWYEKNGARTSPRHSSRWQTCTKLMGIRSTAKSIASNRVCRSDCR